MILRPGCYATIVNRVSLPWHLIESVYTDFYSGGIVSRCVGTYLHCNGNFVGLDSYI